MIQNSYKSLIFASLGFICGLLIGWKLWVSQIPSKEGFAPEVRQRDGSLILKRDPLAKVTSSHIIPSNGILERSIHLVVHPNTQSDKIDIDLSLIRLPDNTHRVIASSKDGTIISGIDIPVNQAKQISPKKWAIGGIYGINKNYGAFIERDLGPFRLGIDVGSNRGSVYTSLRVGIRF